MGIDQLTFVQSCRHLGRQGNIFLCDSNNLWIRVAYIWPVNKLKWHEQIYKQHKLVTACLD